MSRSSRRPLAALLVAAVTLAGLSGCSAIGSSSAAVTINGREWSRDDLNTLMDALVKAGEFSAPNGRADTKDTAGVISVMVQFKAGQQLLESLGIKVDESSRKMLLQNIKQQLPTMAESTQNLLVDIAATGGTIDKIPVPTEQQSSEAYESKPASSGAMCVAEITVKSEADARRVSDELAAGTKFADVARAMTTNTDRKASGGLVVDGADNQCQVLSMIDDQLGAPVLRALYELTPGKPTEAIQDAEGWHIAVNRPWVDIRTEHAKAISPKSDTPTGRQLLAGFIAVADVRVNTVYGTWNPVTTRVE